MNRTTERGLSDLVVGYSSVFVNATAICVMYYPQQGDFAITMVTRGVWYSYVTCFASNFTCEHIKQIGFLAVALVSKHWISH